MTESYERDEYGLFKQPGIPAIAVPDLPFLPPSPAEPLRIGLVGCGSMSEHHLRAYGAAGWPITVLCDLQAELAEEHQRLYEPNARVTDDATSVFDADDVDVVDLIVPLAARPALIRQALDAGKHVLMHPPLADDLETAEALVEHAESAGRLLAVNQHGRWAPHWSFAREAARAGLFGSLQSVTYTGHVPRAWLAGSPHDPVARSLLVDVGIHSLDFVRTLFQPRAPTSVLATTTKPNTSDVSYDSLASVVVTFEDGGQATLSLNGDAGHHRHDSTLVVGDAASIISIGPDFQRQTLQWITADGRARPRYDVAWYPDGFHGAMGALMCGVETSCRPMNDARDHLATLALVMAAWKSAGSGRAETPGVIRRFED